MGRAVLWKQEDGFSRGKQGRGFLANSTGFGWEGRTFSQAGLAFLWWGEGSMGRSMKGCCRHEGMWE